MESQVLPLVLVIYLRDGNADLDPFARSRMNFEERQAGKKRIADLDSWTDEPQTHLTEPEVTRKGIGVGHGLKGELLTELRVLLKTECGHCGGPLCPPVAPLPLLPDARVFRHGIFGHPLTSFLGTPGNKVMSGVIDRRCRLSSVSYYSE